jgi:hypothetical protein
MRHSEVPSDESNDLKAHYVSHMLVARSVLVPICVLGARSQFDVITCERGWKGRPGDASRREILTCTSIFVKVCRAASLSWYSYSVHRHVLGLDSVKQVPSLYLTLLG